MKIVNLTEFRKLPAGTVFAKYKAACFSDLMCKQDTTDTDVLYESLTGNIDNCSTGDFFDKCDEMENGESRPLDFDYTGGDGYSEKDQLFAVYERADIEDFIDKLNRCYKMAYVLQRSEWMKKMSKPEKRDKQKCDRCGGEMDGGIVSEKERYCLRCMYKEHGCEDDWLKSQLRITALSLGAFKPTPTE